MTRNNNISIDLNILTPHAIELASRHIIKENRDNILKVAKQYGMKLVSVSDAHKSRQLGGFCIDTDYDINSEEELIDVIKLGKFTLMEMKLVNIDIK